MPKARRKRARLVSMNVATSTLSTMLVLVLLGTILFFFSVARHVSDTLRDDFTVTLMLDDDMPHAAAYELQQRLRALPCVSRVGYISKAKAAAELAASLGTDPTEFSRSNPLPATFELHLRPDYANGDSLALFLPALQKERYVLDVSYPQELMNEINHNIRNVSLVLLVLAVLLTIISFELINNTMRLAVHSHRFQIRTMKLVGARRGFIRRPFLRRALWVGLVAAVLADALLFAGLHALVDFEPQLAQSITWDVLLITLGGVFVFGVLITTVCASLSVGRYLRMTRERLYLR